MPHARDQPADLLQLEAYDGLLPDEMRRLKQFEDENAKLKKLVADLSLEKQVLRDIAQGKL